MSPFIDLNNNWTLNDLLHPGFPTINNGTFAFTQTNKVNIFSNNALFLAIPSFNSILFIMNCCSLLGISIKSYPKYLFILFENSCLKSFFVNLK